MNILVKRLLISIVLVEIALFLLLYYGGVNGKQMLCRLMLQKEANQQEVELLKKEVHVLTEQIKESCTVFAKEKIARERLHMKKDGETVYFLKNKVENV